MSEAYRTAVVIRQLSIGGLEFDIESLRLSNTRVTLEDPESDMHRDVKEDLWSLMFQVISLSLHLAVGGNMKLDSLYLKNPLHDF